MQLIHLDGRGVPRKDRGGLSKRSLGTLAAAVAVTGVHMLRTPKVLHVAEGIADAVAVAAREDGAVIAARRYGGIRTAGRADRGHWRRRWASRNRKLGGLRRGL